MRDFGFPASVRRIRGRRFGRAVGCAAAAGLLMIGMPSPAGAASPPTVTISDVTLAEGNSGTTDATFTIQVAPRPKGCCPLQVSWSTAGGTANAPGDFTSSSGTVSFTRSVGSRTVSVPVVGDTLDEANETFFVNLSGLVGSPGTIGDAQGVGTITDDDPIPSLSINDVSVLEGNVGTTTATFTVSLSAASGQAVTVDWATVAGTATAGVDYASASGTRTIAAGSTSTTIGVTVNGDTLDEPDEALSVSLSNPTNATIADGSGLGTIIDDDPLPVLTINDVSVVEGNVGTTTATFTVSLSAASGQAVTVDWATAAGTATAGVDYVSTSGARTIAAGSTSTTIGVTVNGDTLDEPDESFNLTLSNPTGATIADATGVGTITDDDPLPVLTIDNVSLVEGNVGTTVASFTVSLSAASGQAVTVDWATADGDATQPSDYLAGSGTLTFLAGDTSETVVVTVSGDLVAELDETFTVTLSNATNAAIGDAAGMGTILDDELEAVIDIDDPVVLEGAAGTTPLAFTVSLSNPSLSTVTVDWATASGSAVGGLDYLEESGTVTFAPLETMKTVQVTVYGDTTYEHDETVFVDLSNATNAPIGNPRGVGTITNDDAAPVLSVGDASIVEGNTGTSVLTFTVSLSGDSDVDASVEYATSDASATAGVDYTASSGTLIVPAGDTDGTVAITVTGDRVYEGNETFAVTLTDPVDATVVDGSATGTITNDDRIPTTLTLRTVKKSGSVTATGLLEPTKTGHRVSVTFFRKRSGKFVKIAAKTVKVKAIKDRDHDGKKDGTYAVTFARPASGGSYKLLAQFKGTATYGPCSRSKLFSLPSL